MIAAVNRVPAGWGEDEMSVLPRHTKVVVTGNNRTKSVLVGLHGVVKKAVGLGGWHWLLLNYLFLYPSRFEPCHSETWEDILRNASKLYSRLVFILSNHSFKQPSLSRRAVEFTPLWTLYSQNLTVLTNGIEVKLQRNALSVIEPPTGNEDDDKFDCENMQWNSSDIASDDAQSPKPQGSRSRQHRGFHRKSLSRSMSCDSHSKTSVSSSSRAHTKVDLSKLELTALWRYWRHFNLDACPNPSREQLVDAVQRHFTAQVDKTNLTSDSSSLHHYDVIVGFVQAAKRLKTTMKVA